MTASTDPDPSNGRPYYLPAIKEVNPVFRNLLETRGVHPSEVVKRVNDVRDKAWVNNPYPCVGEFHFTTPFMPKMKMFPEVLKRLQIESPEQKLLDLGCGFGQDIRNLVTLGVDPKRLVGLDINPAMINFGYELFGDRDKLETEFIIADMLDASSIPEHLLDQFDFIFASLSIHLFNWDRQVQATVNAIKLLKPTPGSILFGIQVGRAKGKEMFIDVTIPDIFIHDPQTYRDLWKEVGKRTGTSWEVSAELMDLNISRVTERDRELRPMYVSARRM